MKYECRLWNFHTNILRPHLASRFVNCEIFEVYIGIILSVKIPPMAAVIQKSIQIIESTICNGFDIQTEAIDVSRYRPRQFGVLLITASFFLSLICD